MDTASAIIKAMANRDSAIKIFDWDKAARLIREKNPHKASAGLSEDWEWTGGKIYENNKIIKDDYTYLASRWAIPQLDMDGKIFDCWIYGTETTWHEHTKWPKSARAILAGTLFETEVKA